MEEKGGKEKKENKEKEGKEKDKEKEECIWGGWCTTRHSSDWGCCKCTCKDVYVVVKREIGQEILFITCLNFPKKL